MGAIVQRFDPSSMTVLIVDDHDPIRKAVRRVVSAMGFVKIIECFDGSDALRVLKSGAIDLVILDLYMKRINGIDVLQHISDRSIASDIPVLVVTGEANKEDIVKASSLGASEYLLKPFQAHDLEKKILSILNRYHAPVPTSVALHHAERHLIDGRYDEALLAYGKSIELDPGNPRAIVGKALVASKIGQIDSALNLLSELVLANPQYHKAYRAMADILLESGRPNDAISALKRELSINPKQADRQIHLAKLLLKAARPKEAIDHFKAAIRVSPKNPAALMGLGHAFAADGNLEKSVYYFHRVRRYLPTSLRPLEAALRHCIEAGEPKKAEYLLKDERKISSDKLEISALLASFYLQQKRDAEALEVVQEILSKSPEHAQALRICGNIHLHRGNLNDALPVLERVVRLLPSPDAYNNLAEVLILMRQIGQSLDTLNESMRLDPSKPKTFILMAQVHVMTQQWFKATLLYQKALQLGADPDKILSEISLCRGRGIVRRDRLSA